METAIHDALELRSEFHPEQSRVDEISDNSKTTSVLPPPSNLTANAFYRWGENSHATHIIADSRTRQAIFAERCHGTHFKSLSLETTR